MLVRHIYNIGTHKLNTNDKSPIVSAISQADFFDLNV